MLALTAACSMAALKFPVPASTEPQLRFGRKQFVATALGSLLVPRAAHAGFSTEKAENMDPERLQQLRGSQQDIFGGDAAYIRVTCSKDDEECLAKKRAGAKSLFLGDDGSSAAERKAKRTADIQRQAGACRFTCGNEYQRITCAAGDEECLAEKKRLQTETGGLTGESIFPGVVALAGVVAARIATAPEKSSNPKGMQIKEEYYAKRKRDTEEAIALGLSVEGGGTPQFAFDLEKAREKKAAEDAAAAAAASAADKAE